MKSLIGLALVVFSSFFAGKTFAQSMPTMVGVKTAETADSFRLTYEFSDVVATEAVTVDFKGEAIVVDIPNVELEKKISAKVDSSIIKNVAAEKVDGGIKGTINYRGIKASDFKDGISVETTGKALTIIIKNPAHIVAKLPEKTVLITKALPEVPPTTLPENENLLEVKAPEQSQDEAPVAASEAKGEDTALAANVTEEKAIPVLATKGKVADSNAGAMQKVAMTVVALFVFGVGAFFMIRKHSLKVNKESSLMQIKVISQYHLAPKKTIAVIRVAGESILVGITDQNITLLKSLAILDEDLPEVNQKDFGSLIFNKQNQVLSDEEVSEEFSFGGVRNQVVSKMKGMRSLV